MFWYAIWRVWGLGLGPCIHVDDADLLAPSKAQGLGFRVEGLGCKVRGGGGGG